MSLTRRSFLVSLAAAAAITEIDAQTGMPMRSLGSTGQKVSLLAFGAGTLPAVIGVGVMTSLLVRLSSTRQFRRLAGVSLIALAVLATFPWLNPLVLHVIPGSF